VDSFSDLLLRARTLRRVRINNNGLGPEGGTMLAGVLERVVVRGAAQTSSVSRARRSSVQRDGGVAAPSASQETLAKDGQTMELTSLIMGRNRLENKAAAALAKGAK